MGQPKQVVAMRPGHSLLMRPADIFIDAQFFNPLSPRQIDRQTRSARQQQDTSRFIHERISQEPQDIDIKIAPRKNSENRRKNYEKNKYTR